MKYGYYPGCSLERNAIAYHQSAMAVAGPMGIEFNELEDWKKQYNDYPQIISALHTGYKQEASKECLENINNKQSVKLSTLKGKMSDNVPCTCWTNMAISSNGDMLQCCDAPYTLNYGDIQKHDCLDLWQNRLYNMMDNPACQECNLKKREWKAVLQEYLKV